MQAVSEVNCHVSQMPYVMTDHCSVITLEARLMLAAG